MANLPRLIFQQFKARGLSIRSDASKALENVLQREVDALDALNMILEEVKDRIEKRQIKSSVIDIDVVSDVVAALTSNDDDLEVESLQVIDAYHCHKVLYNEKTRGFTLSPSSRRVSLGLPEQRSAMYRERLLLTQQRLLRSGLLAMRSGGTGSEKSELSTIDGLLGSSGTRVLLGLLTQPEEGVWFLEDLTSSIRIDLSHALTYPVLYTEGSIVIAQGSLCEGGVFRVDVMGFPPAEGREATLSALGCLSDPWALGIRPQQMQHMAQLEQQSTDVMIIFLSNVHLDVPAVTDKFAEVLEGFDGAGGSPVFVLIGNFLASSVQSSGGKAVALTAFNKLADMIQNCGDTIRNAKFIVVPGPGDPGIGTMLPRAPLPSFFTRDIATRLPNVQFVSNPCRLRFYTQEILIFREDLLRKMQRHTIIPLKTGPDDPEITTQLVESILDQGHLFPLPQTARPVQWDLDHALRLTPLPNLLVLADHSEQYSLEYKECFTVNPGSFASDSSFMVYRPATRDVEFSRVS